MDDAISVMEGLLSSETDARIALITIVVFVIFVVIAFALCTVLYKMYRSIRSESKKEYDKEQTETEYHKKVDESIKEIQSLAKLINHIGEQINKSNENSEKEFQNIKTMIEDQSIKGCPFGQHTKDEVDDKLEDLKSDVLGSIQSDITLLLESDRERIKSYITEQYHTWMKLGYIDIYSLKSIDEQYIRYRRENGNTFVTSMVQELHKLPTKVVTQNCVTNRMIAEAREEKILPSDYFKDEDADGVPDFIDGI